MARARRIDYSTLKAPTRRADGTLVAEALLTRTGVFSYRNPDGSERREYRPPTQVFDAKSMDSFKLVPLTDDHPPVMITSQNARQYQVGAVGENIRKDGNFVAATIAVHDAGTIAKMDGGKTAVSCGYECDLDETPGMSPDGERYDAVQTNIVGNHLAIVTNARAGSAAAVRMDAAAMIDPDDKNTGRGSPAAGQGASTHRKDSTMTLEEALAKAEKRKKEREEQRARADAAEARVKELEKEHGTLKAEVSTLTAKRDSLVTELAASEKGRKDAADLGPALVKERVALLTAANAVIGPKLKRADGAEVALFDVPDRELKLAVIKRVENVDCDLDPATKAKRDDVYVGARYDAAIERAAKSTQVFAGVGDVILQNRMRVDGNADTSQAGDLAKAHAEKEKARKDMIERNQGWNQPATAGGAGQKGE